VNLALSSPDEFFLYFLNLHTSSYLKLPQKNFLEKFFFELAFLLPNNSAKWVRSSGQSAKFTDLSLQIPPKRQMAKKTKKKPYHLV
jgi:hypothetical protein